MPELIGLRECGRRLGVSDTAVRKAIAAGHIAVAGHTERSNRPLVDWDVVPAAWQANTRGDKRSHIGSQGSPQRAKDAPRVHLPPSSRMDEIENNPGAEVETNNASRYAKARAAREEAEAALALLKYETAVGKLVAVDEVGAAVDTAFTRVRQRLLAIGNAAAPELLGLSSVVEAQGVIDSYVREALEELSHAYG